jgi:hypothetical protein
MILNMNGLNIPDNQKPLTEEEQTMLWSNKLDKRKHNDQQILYMVLNRNYMIDKFMTSESWNNRSYEVKIME